MLLSFGISSIGWYIILANERIVLKHLDRVPYWFGCICAYMFFLLPIIISIIIRKVLLCIKLKASEK